MKKLLYFISILAIAAVIFLAGLYRKNQRTDTQQADAQESTADTGETEVYEPNEQEYFAQLQKDKEAAEEKNIYTKEDGYQSFGGFGYEVKFVKKFDTFEEFRDSKWFVEEYFEYDVNNMEEWKKEELNQAEIIYIEYEVTNEKPVKQQFCPLNMDCAYVNERGYNYDDTKGWHEEEGRGVVSGMWSNHDFYVATIPDPVDEKNTCNPILQPGEKISLQIAYECTAWKGNKGEEESVEVKPTELYEGEWYLVLPGTAMIMNETYNIYEDKLHKFIKLDVE